MSAWYFVVHNYVTVIPAVKHCSAGYKMQCCVLVAKCPEPTGYFAHPCDCNKFLQCAGGIMYEKKCPDGLRFDPTKKACDHAVNVKCHLSGSDASNSMRDTMSGSDAMHGVGKSNGLINEPIKCLFNFITRYNFPFLSYFNVMKTYFV